MFIINHEFDEYEKSHKESESNSEPLLDNQQVLPQFVDIDKDEQKHWCEQNGLDSNTSTTYLSTPQKHAIVRLAAFVQGASVLSVYDEDANKIVQSLFSEFGMSVKDVETCLRSSMMKDGERELKDIVDTLCTVSNKEYLRNLYSKMMHVAYISEDADTINEVRGIFKILNI